MSKKEERIKLGLGMFCSVCILTMGYLLLINGNTTDLLTDFNQVDKVVNVIFSKDEEINQVIVEPYDVVNFENIAIEDTTVNDYEVTFGNYSGYIDYTFYIENKSSKIAVLKDFELPNPVCKGFQEDCEKVLIALDYKLKYEDGSEVQTGDTINGREKKKVKLTIKYNANKYDLPSASTSITNLGFTLSYTGK